MLDICDAVSELCLNELQSGNIHEMVKLVASFNCLQFEATFTKEHTLMPEDSAHEVY